MSDTGTRKSQIWRRRERVGLARERVAAQLDPPISSKTLERWEKNVTPIPGWRKVQLEALYEAAMGQAA